MIRRIRLCNFMAHIDTVIEPAEGLTVLVGPNNCGKSAVVAALQAICENTNGAGFVLRHGTKEARVTVETDDGHTIAWVRKPHTASYIIDGTRIDRGQAPENLHDLLRLASVTTPDGKDSFDVHFGVQKSPIFLLDQPASRAAMFFASSSDASKLMEMQRLHKARVVERRRDEKRLTMQVDKLQGHLSVLEPVQAVQDAVQAAEALHSHLLTALTQASTLQRDLEALVAQERAVTLAQARCTALAPLSAPPSLADTQALVELLAELKRVDRDYLRESARCAGLAPLSDPPSLADTQPLELLCCHMETHRRQVAVETAKGTALDPLAAPPAMELTEPLEAACQKLAVQDRLVGHLQGRSTTLSQLPDPPAQQDVAAAEVFIEEFEQAIMSAQAAEAQVAALEGLSAVPTLADAAPLAALLEELAAAEAQAQGHRQSLQEAQADLDAAIAALQDWAETNPFCPTCGAAIDPERLLVAGGHDHG